MKVQVYSEVGKLQWNEVQQTVQTHAEYHKLIVETCL